MITQQLKTIHHQTEELLNEAAELVSPFKLDRQAFAFDNLWDRYRNRTNRLREIQLLVRKLQTDETEAINTILSK